MTVYLSTYAEEGSGGFESLLVYVRKPGMSMSGEPRRLGKYELRERPKRGGMGEVWKAYDTRLKRYVAIKLLHASLQNDPDFIIRFEHEAQFIASLHHPNIVQIHDFNVETDPASDSTTAYMVMNFVEGETLADYIRSTSRKGQFPSSIDLVNLFASISLAIDYAHQKGMIHRDIKPANILLDKRATTENPMGEPILTDFGIAKLQGSTSGTVIGSLLGTPLYVSPEQARGIPGNERSDLYSLGIILYEMTTGITPFRGETAVAILMQQVQEMPTPPSLINPNIPAALNQVILRSIAKAPEERYPTASSMTIALAEALNVPVPPSLKESVNANNAGTIHNPLQPSSPPGTTPPWASSLDTSSSYSYLAESRPATTMTPPVNTGYAPDHSSPPLEQSLPAKSVTPPSFWRRRRTLSIVLVLLLIALIGSSVATYLLSSTRSTPPSTIVGHVHFLSSTNPSSTADELQIDLQNIAPPDNGKVYYAWLQSPKTESETRTGPHWLLSFQNGSIHSVYKDAHYKNLLDLLGPNSYLLITVETANQPPLLASIDPAARRYYANLPQTSSSSTPTFNVQGCPMNSTFAPCAF